MAEAKNCDVFIIGAGPAGYTAAIRLGQLGKKVIVAEKEKMGGVCLNVGCIPSKALIHIADTCYKISHSQKLGIVSDVKIDFVKMQEWKEGMIAKLRGGIEFLCKANNVEIIKGTASFVSSKQAKIISASGEIIIDFEKAIIASGSIPMEAFTAKLDGINIIGSTEVLSMNKKPTSLAVIGSGYIGMELSTFFAKIGTKVTIIERSDDLLKLVDSDIRDVVKKRAGELGMNFIFNTSIVSTTALDGKVVLKLKENSTGKESELEAEKVMVAIGRKPFTDGLGLEQLGIAKDARGFLIVDDLFRTNVSNIYAIGDLIGGQMLAHKGYAEGKLCAEIIAGIRDKCEKPMIPYVVFSDPEVAIVGLSEQDAKAQNIEVKISKYPFSALGRAAAIDDTLGFVKIIAEAKTDKILGFHLVGPDASNMVGELALTLSMNLTIEDVAATIHPHPSLSEAIGESAELMLGKSVHFMNKKK